MKSNTVSIILSVQLAFFLGLSRLSTAIAQIVPDQTLPEHSVVNIEGPLHRITVGTVVGPHLFHSFQEFSLPTGNVAQFENDVNIQTIFSRVTGSSISNLDGLIKANGNANLVFINPNGIIFGPNARLNLGGSFLATTANGIEFSDRNSFSTTTPHNLPLLTISVPIGLQLGENPGAMIYQGGASSIPDSHQGGLVVNSGQTLALIGGEITLEGGQITAPFGRIHLGSIASPTFVNLTLDGGGFMFDYQPNQAFGNIQLSQSASLDASGVGGGSIELRGNHITLNQSSQVISHTLAHENGRGIDIQSHHLRIQDNAWINTHTYGLGKGGDVRINAGESIEIQGTGFEAFEQTFVASLFDGQRGMENRGTGIITTTGTPGTGGNITLNTPRLILDQGAVIAADSFGSGTGGELTVHAEEFIEMNASGLLLTAGASGATGDLNLETGQLTVTDGATIASITLNQGEAGNINIQSDSGVELQRKPANSVVPTGIFVGSIGGTGSGGDITMNTQNLRVEDGALIANVSGVRNLFGIIPVGGTGGNIFINATELVEVSGISADQTYVSGVATTSYSASQSGQITVVTNRLLAKNGGFIGASTAGSAPGGTVNIYANESIELVGTSMDNRGISGLFSSSGDVFFPVDATGSAGNLRVFTGHLVLREGSQVAVNSLGSGNAGKLDIFADSIQVSDGSLITAETLSGQGGNIQIQARFIALQRQGNINTNAGNNDGGNIAINTETLVALENSNITANAQAGLGGQVRIDARGVFGAEFREMESPKTSDITATSELGVQFSGVVDINTPDVQPTSGLVELPKNMVDMISLIGQDPCLQQGESEFIMTGRGGLPPHPGVPMTEGRPFVDLGVPVSLGSEGALSFTPVPIPDSSVPEARGWIRMGNGMVRLVGPKNQNFITFFRPVLCIE